MITPAQTAQISQVLKANAPASPAGGSGGGWYSQVTSAPTPAAKPTSVAKPNAMVSDIQDAGNNIKSDVVDTSTNPIEKTVRGASDIATGATNVAADVIPGGKTALGALGTVVGAGENVAGNIGNTLADLATKVHLMTPEQKLTYEKANSDFANSDSGKSVSQIATDLVAAGNVAGTVAGGIEGAGALGKGLDVVKTGAGAVKDAATAVVTKTPEQIAAAKAQTEASAQKAKLNDAISRSTPDYESMNPTQKANLRTQSPVNGTPRVQENNAIGGKRTVTPTAVETAAGTELSKVPGYDPKATNLDIYNKGHAEIAKSADALSNSLEGEKILVPPAEMLSTVKKAVNSVPETSLVLSRADPVIKQYIRVAQNAIKEAPGTLKGVLDVRKSMDGAYNYARGKLAFSPDKLSSLDEVHEAGRDALNKKAIDTARNTDVKASLQKQFHLYKALDEVGRRADREAGNGLGRFMQQHPAITNTVKAVARTAGLGGIVHLAE